MNNTTEKDVYEIIKNKVDLDELYDDLQKIVYNTHTHAATATAWLRGRS